jgi:hypothetical protein
MLEIFLPRMRLSCSINSVLPTTSNVYVLRDVWHEIPKHQSKSMRRRVRRQRQWLTSNGTIKSDAAVQPPNLLFSSVSPSHFRQSSGVFHPQIA